MGTVGTHQDTALLEAWFRELALLLTGQGGGPPRFEFSVHGAEGSCTLVMAGHQTLEIELPLLGHGVPGPREARGLLFEIPTGIEARWLQGGGRRTLRTGDQGFDHRVAITFADRDEGFVRQLAQDPEVRRILQEALAFTPSTKVLLCDGRPTVKVRIPLGQLRVDGALPLERIPPLIEALLTLSRRITPPSSCRSLPGERAILWLMGMPFLGLGLSLILSLGMRGEAWKSVELNPASLDVSWPIFGYGALLNLIFAGFWLRELRRSGLGLGLLFGPLALFLHQMPSYMYASFLNSGLDFSEPRVVQARVLERNLHQNKGRATGECWLILGDVFTPGDRYRLSGRCDRLPHGKAKLTVGEGRLGVRHVRRIE